MARTLNCGRPNCDNIVSFDKAYGMVELQLERRVEDDDSSNLAVLSDTTVCSSCSNDLADFWLYGKK